MFWYILDYMNSLYFVLKGYMTYIFLLDIQKVLKVIMCEEYK